jgi:putative aldouronate transport system substrate-binding protein
MKAKKMFAVMAILPVLIAAAGWAGGKSDSASAGAEGPLSIKMTVRLFDQVPDMNNAYWKYYQEKTNTRLDVEWIPDGDYRTKLNLILSSNALPEVLIANATNDLNNPAFINAVQNGAFWDLTDVFGDFSKYPNLRDRVAPDAWQTSRVLSRIYGVPQNVSRVQGGPIIREDLVKKAGKRMPTNMDELLDVLEAVVKQNPGMIGMVSKQNVFTQSDGGFIAAFGGTVNYYDDQGGLVQSRLRPSHTKFVAWMREAYRRGILSKEFAVMTPTQATEYFQSGAAVMLINESFRWCYPFTKTLQEKVDPNAVAQMVPPLEGEKGYYNAGAGVGWVDLMCIAKKVPEAKMKRILDYFEMTTTDEYYDLTTYGIEGIHYTRDADGYKVVAPQRDKDLGSSAPWQVLPLIYNPYQKLDSTAAPEQYNIAQRKLFSDYEFDVKGIYNPIGMLTSKKWQEVWPRYQQTFAAKCVQATTGEISMTEYERYVDSVNADPDVRQSYQELAKAYKDLGLKAVQMAGN